jgi:hypothetical protein
MYVNQHDFFISKDKVLEEASGLNPDGTPRADAAPVEDMWVKTAGIRIEMILSFCLLYLQMDGTERFKQASAYRRTGTNSTVERDPVNCGPGSPDYPGGLPDEGGCNEGIFAASLCTSGKLFNRLPSDINHV